MNRSKIAHLTMVVVGLTLLASCGLNGSEPATGSSCSPGPDAGTEDCSFNPGHPKNFYSASDLSELQPICDSNCRRAYGISIFGVEGVETLQALKGIEEIKWNFEVDGNPDLVSFGGVSALRQVGGVKILNNDSLTSIESLSSLETVEHVLTVERNKRLSTLDGLGKIQTVGDQIDITSNEQLQSLEPLKGLETKNLEKLNITRNPKLEDLRGLGSIEVVSKTLSIDRNERLESLDGLHNIRRVEGDLYIEGNGSLGRCEIEEFIEQLEEPPRSIRTGDNGDPICKK